MFVTLTWRNEELCILIFFAEENLALFLNFKEARHKIKAALL